MFRKVCGLQSGLRGLYLAACLVLLSARPVWAAPTAQSAADGAEIFRQKCSGCHTIGSGRLSGPDLQGVTAQRDREWLARFILEPDKVLAEGDPIATALLQEYAGVPMPALGLSVEEVEAVIAHLEASESGASALTAVQEPAAAPATGDPERGKALFAGTVDLYNGGTPCLGCHSAGKTGLLGGGTMGPDLTQVATRYGAGLPAALAGIPWPTMAPIYTRHPLTPEEQADLLAFLQALSDQQPANREWVVLALSLAGLAGALALIGFVWRRRLRGVRRPMVEQARTK